MEVIEEYWCDSEEREELSVAIYYREGERSVLYENCTQPICHLKIEDPWFPVFCECGHTYIVPVGCGAQCVRCKRENAETPFEVNRPARATYRSKTFLGE